MDSFEHKLKDHVRTKMAKHKKIKKHELVATRKTRVSLEDELMVAEAVREAGQSLHDLVCEGLELLFPDTSGTISHLNEHRGGEQRMLQEALQTSVQNMSRAWR